MKYAQSDSNGNISAFYDSAINSSSQIGTAIKITDAQWLDCIDNPGKWQIISGALSLTPPPSADVLLASAKTTQIAALTASYAAAIQRQVAYMGTNFQADTGSQNTLVQTLSAMTPAGSTPAGFYWVDAANNHVAMTLAQLQGLAQAMVAQGWTAFQNLQQKKSAVNSAGTVSAVQAITF